VGDVIPLLDLWYGYQCAWATSTLAARGKPPAVPKDSPDDGPDFEYERAYMEWSCMYAAGNSPTAILYLLGRGRESDGIGETLSRESIPKSRSRYGRALANRKSSIEKTAGPSG
jgi:hypothetical protein